MTPPTTEEIMKAQEQKIKELQETIKEKTNQINDLEDKISRKSNKIKILERNLKLSRNKTLCLMRSCQNLKWRNSRLISRNSFLNKQFTENKNTLESHLFKQHLTEEKMMFYTGLPSFEIFDSVFDFVENYISQTSCSKLTKKQEFILVLMRLRLGLLEQDLAYRFQISQPTVSRIIHKWITVMSARLSYLIHWPDRDSLRKTMPSCFKESFEKCVVILDCFEIFIEKPNDLTARAETYSQYKSHNTMKVLVGITPQGTISYVSEPWGGRTSDVHLTENCGILEKLIPGDTVLADRGFTIGDSVSLYCAELKIPAFTKGKSQLERKNIDETREIAHVRIHVERVIGLLRNKYTILQKILPIKMIQLKQDWTCSLTQILIVCSALCNLNPTIVPLD